MTIQLFGAHWLPSLDVYLRSIPFRNRRFFIPLVSDRTNPASNWHPRFLPVEALQNTNVRFGSKAH
jgi:hypothetical protein